MAQAIRVGDGKSWRYVPANRICRDQLSHFASLGLANVSNGAVLLKSDAGPIFWDAIQKDKPHSDPHMRIAMAINAIADNSIALQSGEKMVLGESGDKYNKFADVSIVEAPPSSIKMSSDPIEDGQIVLSVWPKNKQIIPGKATISGRRINLELATAAEKGERSFILSEDGSLLTISFPSDGTERVFAMNQEGICGWLRTIGAKSSAESKFFIKHESCGAFHIMDGKTGRTYSGRFKSAPDTDDFSLEKMLVERLLTSKGIGAILPTYQLRRA